VNIAVAGESSVVVKWLQPDSVGEIVSCRVDAFTKSAGNADYQQRRV
jgi:hypothetical protein